MAAFVLVLLSSVLFTAWSRPVNNSNSNSSIFQTENEIAPLATSTTTPPSVLFPPKPYLLFEKPGKSLASSKNGNIYQNNQHHHHHHSVIKLPKIQVHKVYYTSESAPPVTTLAKPRSQVYFREEKEPNGKSPDFSDIIVANETKRYTEVDESDNPHYNQQQSQQHHNHPHPHPHSHPSSSAHDHQDGYNPAVLEDEGSVEEPMNDEPEMQHSPPLDEAYGKPQIPPPLYSAHPQNPAYSNHHHHQILPPEALKQVLRPALSNEMLDDELAQINQQIIHGYQNNRDSFEQYLKKMNHHAKAVSENYSSLIENQ